MLTCTEHTTYLISAQPLQNYMNSLNIQDWSSLIKLFHPCYGLYRGLDGTETICVILSFHCEVKEEGTVAEGSPITGVRKLARKKCSKYLQKTTPKNKHTIFGVLLNL